MFFVLDEATIRRVVGSENLMRRQLNRLVELNTNPRVTIRVMPFSAGAYIGMLGPFTYLSSRTTRILTFCMSRVRSATPFSATRRT